ncbi:MAG: SLC13 family permease [Thermoprotei archaeon]|jgi:Na+/H+ antiporter NhaD/arsenite permease-like protein
MNEVQIITLAIFVTVYGAIALRNILRVDIPIWTIMLSGAVASVASNVITPENAYKSINMDVIIFLFSMFTIVTALEVSGVLDYFTNWLLTHSRKPDDVILLILFGIGLISAFLMNDTLALMGTPIMLHLSKKMNIDPKPLLITLAFAITIGSAMTPMGNPQNLLIALVSNIPAPLVTFTYYLIFPTLVNLFLTYLVLKLWYKKEISKAKAHFAEIIRTEMELRSHLIKDSNLAKLVVIVSILTISGIIFSNVAQMFGYHVLSISWISLIGATILLIITPRRRELIKNLDWSILVLFGSMFILMQTVYNNGVLEIFAKLLPPLERSPMSIFNIILVSVILSQFVSNVPMVSLYLPLMKKIYDSNDIKAWTALAGGSTLAGNLTLLGAASNLIIVEEAENKGYTLGFFEFLKIGLIITIINVFVLFIFLVILP